MKRHASSSYTIVHPSGEITRDRIPDYWSPIEVAEKLPHSLIFLHVKVGFSVSGRDWNGQKDWRQIDGPCVVIVYQGNLYLSPSGAPRSDGHAYKIFRNVNAKAT